MKLELELRLLAPNPKRTAEKWTTGVTCNPRSGEGRLFLFEVDREEMDKVPLVLGVLSRIFDMTFLHCTGNGVHFYSSPLVTKEAWKEVHNLLRDINVKCPMTTLRVEPNKWVGEEKVWYQSYIIDHENGEYASLSPEECAEFLEGFKKKLQTVRYPLP